MVLEGGTILKQAPFWGVHFSLVKNMRGSNFMTGTIIFSLTHLFKVYNTCYSDL